MIFRPGLTARHVIQTLGEHALAFWNYYNDKPLSEEELDKEISEDSINGILLLTAYSEYVTHAVFNRRLNKLVMLSEGAMTANTARNLLAKALGHQTTGGKTKARKFHEELERKGRIDNLNWTERNTKIPALLNKHDHNEARRARFHGNEAGKVAMDAVQAELGKIPHLSSKGEATHWCNEFWRANGDISLKLSKRLVARALGYSSWVRMQKVLQRYGLIPNLRSTTDEALKTEVKAFLLTVEEERVAKEKADAIERRAKKQTDLSGHTEGTPVYRAAPSPALPPVIVRKKRTLPK
jgi:hypothetical protein